MPMKTITTPNGVKHLVLSRATRGDFTEDNEILVALSDHCPASLNFPGGYYFALDEFADAAEEVLRPVRTASPTALQEKEEEARRRAEQVIANVAVRSIYSGEPGMEDLVDAIYEQLLEVL